MFSLLCGVAGLAVGFLVGWFFGWMKTARAITARLKASRLEAEAAASRSAPPRLPERVDAHFGGRSFPLQRNAAGVYTTCAPPHEGR